MSAPELIITGLVYVTCLVVGQRLTALFMPATQEVGFVVGAAIASLTAALLYHRRSRSRASTEVKLTVGGVLSILAVLVGMTAQLMWESMRFPLPISLMGAAVVALAFPFLLFPLGRRVMPEAQPLSRDLDSTHVVIAAVLTLVLVAGAIAMPVPGRSTVQLNPAAFPGLRIKLPHWQAAEQVAQPDYGAIRLIDPAREDRFLSVRWTRSDPVQPDDYVRVVTGGALDVRERTPTLVSDHEAVTYLLEAPDRSSSAYATIWNCRQDHRVLWVFSHLAARPRDMLATHRRIVQSLRCHAGGEVASTQKIFPTFAAPPGFMRNAQSPLLAFKGPKGELIVFDAGVVGRSPLVSEEISPQAVAALLQGLGLEQIQSAPQVQTVTDLLGHDRRVWSAAGTGYDRKPVQVEVMVWYCENRRMTFIGGYATPAKHEAREGVDAMLPAACH